MSATPGLDRRAAVRELLSGRGGLLVVTGLGSPTYDVFAAGDHDGNFYLWGAMGGAALVGLGLALAQPERSVLVLTGDGEQLMGAGGLLTIGVQQPNNLTVAVLDNGHYGETGMQKSHTGLGARLELVAQAAGFSAIDMIGDQAGIARLRDTMKTRGNGPRFALIRIAADNVPRALPPRDGTYLKNRFRGHLGLMPN